MTVEPSRRGLARRLWRLADLVRAAEGRRSFRSKAYRTAVWTLDDLPSLSASDEEILATRGIGPGVAALIHEYRTTGELRQLIPLEEAYPADSGRLRRLPRMRPAMLRDLKSLGIETTGDLLEAIGTGAVETLRGVGPQTLDLWSRVLELPPGPGHVPSHEAWVTATTLARHIAAHTGAWVDVAGQVRRMEEWVERIDLVSVNDDATGLTEFISDTASLDHAEPDDDVLRGVTHSGLEVCIHPAPPEAAGTVLLWATGPERHASSVTREPYPTEHEAYRSVDLPLIPAPARHLPVESALGVVGVADLGGDLHLHSELSPDGRMSLLQILRAAGERGYSYFAITDHTQGLRFGGLDESGISAQALLIAEARKQFPEMTILHGAELNIGPDGSLDLDEGTLERLDFAVAGVHSHFGLDSDTQTKRVVIALSHPSVRVLAHPRGRRIGIRPPLSLDMDEVVDTATANGVALEVNGHRDRLDLSAEWIHHAAKRGAVFAANSDAHRVPEIDNIDNAIGTLQRAGIGPGRIVNTFAVTEFLHWVSGGEGNLESL